MAKYTSSTMVKASQLIKNFGARVVVDGISFDAKKGEILALLGPNGAGKTTTIRMMIGFLSPNSGTISVGGCDVVNEPFRVKSLIGYLPETPPLYSELTVQEYLSFVLRLRGINPKKEKSRLDDAYQKCGIGDVRGRLIGNLSKGYRQRVGLAQALVHDPKVLILDEPTVGLDPKQIREIRELIKGLAGEHTVILSSHILPEVAKTCDRVVIINEGRIVASDTCDSLSTQISGGSRIEVILSRSNAGTSTHLQTIKGVRNVIIKAESGVFIIEGADGLQLREEVAKMVVQKDWGLQSLRPLEFSLEDVFLKLTMEESPEVRE